MTYITVSRVYSRISIDIVGYMLRAYHLFMNFHICYLAMDGRFRLSNLAFEEVVKSFGIKLLK